MNAEDRTQIAVLATEVKNLNEKVDHMSEKIDKLEGQANRWKGAFFVILALGGVLTWIADWILSHLHR